MLNFEPAYFGIIKVARNDVKKSIYGNFSVASLVNREVSEFGCVFDCIKDRANQLALENPNYVYGVIGLLYETKARIVVNPVEESHYFTEVK